MSSTGRGAAGATACGVVAVLAGAASLSPLFTDLTWAPVVAAVVVLVGVTGVGARSVRAPLPLVVVLQVLVVAVLATVLFSTTASFGVLPGPGALAELRGLLAGAGVQIREESVPVPVTPELQLLLVLLVGAAAVVVDGLVSGLHAPAGAGLVLLTLVAVPASLLDELLPWWSFLLAAGGLLALLAADGPQRASRSGPAAGWAGLRAPAVLGTVGVAVAAALLAGSGGLGVGTQGRLDGPGTGGVAINPFTQLRGQLDQPDRVPLFTVEGLADPTYLRALSLDTYVTGQGWVLDATVADEEVTGALADEPSRGQPVAVTVVPQRYDDRWLPVPGAPLLVSGADGALADYSYDTTLDTLHREDAAPLPGYQVQAVVPLGSAEELRAGGSPTAGEQGAPDPRFYRTGGIDPEVARLAREVTGSTTTELDAAVALTEWFRDPANGFTYDLATVDGGSSGDPLVDFLTVGRTGYCEQYASAMGAMLRTLGIPSRLGVGFTAGTGDVGGRQITTSDAHAWVEVYFADTGWVIFDPTPLGDGRGVVPSYVTQALDEPVGATPTTSAAAPTSGSAAPPTAAPAPVDQADGAPSAADAGAGAPSAWPRRLAVAAVVLLTVVAVVAAPAALRRQRRRARWADGAADRVWEELLDCAADRGAAPWAGGTPRRTAERMVAEHGLDETGALAVHAVVDAVEGLWYGPAGGAGAVRTEVRPVVDDGRAAVDAFTRCAPVSVRRRVLPLSLRPGRGASGLELRG